MISCDLTSAKPGTHALWTAKFSESLWGLEHSLWYVPVCIWKSALDLQHISSKSNGTKLATVETPFPIGGAPSVSDWRQSCIALSKTYASCKAPLNTDPEWNRKDCQWQQTSKSSKLLETHLKIDGKYGNELDSWPNLTKSYQISARLCQDHHHEKHHGALHFCAPRTSGSMRSMATPPGRLVSGKAYGGIKNATAMFGVYQMYKHLKHTLNTC